MDCRGQHAQVSHLLLLELYGLWVTHVTQGDDTSHMISRAYRYLSPSTSIILSFLTLRVASSSNPQTCNLPLLWGRCLTVPLGIKILAIPNAHRESDIPMTDHGGCGGWRCSNEPDANCECMSQHI
jgi:hypothetical protein